MNVIKAMILLLIGAPSILYPQQGTEGLGKQRCEQFQRDGWTVPGLQGAKEKGRGPIEDWNGVFLSVLDPGEADTWLITSTCLTAADKPSESHRAPIHILKLWRFDTGRAPFAYRVEYSDDVIHQNGTRGHLASQSVIFFYDTDGAGLFTLMRASSMTGRNYFYPDFIPEWARVSPSTQSGK